MSAHTPGPWLVLRDPEVGGPLVATEDVAIADVMEMEGGMSEANARLIAAAPDLLAALRQVVESAYPNPDEHPTMTAAWRVAEAAIAKAEGR